MGAGVPARFPFTRYPFCLKIGKDDTERPESCVDVVDASDPMILGDGGLPQAALR